MRRREQRLPRLPLPGGKLLACPRRGRAGRRLPGAARWAVQRRACPARPPAAPPPRSVRQELHRHRQTKSLLEALQHERGPSFELAATASNASELEVQLASWVACGWLAGWLPAWLVWPLAWPLAWHAAAARLLLPRRALGHPLRRPAAAASCASALRAAAMPTAAPRATPPRPPLPRRLPAHPVCRARRGRPVHGARGPHGGGLAFC
jgi:hypothetical protein